MSKRQKTKNGQGRKPKAANKTKSKANKGKKLKRLLPPIMKPPTSPLGKCLEDFIKASANPFQSRPACLPHSPALDSAKRKYSAKGTVIVGQEGFGYVVATTQLANNATTGFGFTRGWYASSLLYNGSTLPNNMSSGAIDGTGEQSGCYNTGMNTSALTLGQKEGRPVALGIRVRYLGTETARGGRLVCFEHPNHANIDGYGISNCFQYEFVESVPNERKWTVALWQHKVPSELAYSSHLYPVPNLAIFIDGAVGDKYEFEIFYHAETITRDSDPNAGTGKESPTYVDDGLFSVITGMMARTLTTTQDAFSYLTQSELSTYAAQLLRVAYKSTQIYTGGRQLLLLQ